MKLNPCRYYSNSWQQVKKAWDAWSQHERTHTQKKQTRKINKIWSTFCSCYDDWFFDSCPVKVNRWYHPVFYDLIHWLYGYFYTGPVCFYQKSCKPCEWSHDLCNRSGIFEDPNDSLQWIILLFSYIKCFLWNNVKPRRVL